MAIIKKKKKRNYLKENENIKAIKVILDYNVISFEKLFMECEYIESIYFKKFYRNDIENMNSMFARCFSLKELNLSNFNTNSVTNINGMFYRSLEELKKKKKFNIKI